MAAIVEEITVEATPQRVYEALTQQDEIVRWWANEAHIRPEVGSLGTFHYNATRIIFTHDGFARVDEAIERVRENWAFFLSSLKSYLETGKGTPGTPPNLK